MNEWKEVRDGYRYENGYKVVLNGPSGGWWVPLTPEGKGIKRDGRVVHFRSEAKAKAYIEKMEMRKLEKQFDTIVERIFDLSSLGPDAGDPNYQEARIADLEKKADVLDAKIHHIRMGIIA